MQTERFPFKTFYCKEFPTEDLNFLLKCPLSILITAKPSFLQTHFSSEILLLHATHDKSPLAHFLLVKL